MRNLRVYINWFLEQKIGYLLSDKVYVKLHYWCITGQHLNLRNPQSFNEKMQWLKLYDRNPFYTELVDKDKVKKFIADNFGAKYVIPTIGIWDSPESIDWTKLPSSFVLKATHDSGGLVICRNKEELNKEQTICKLKKSIEHDYFLSGREWPYKNVQRKIIAEKFMGGENGEGLRDYKFFCFEGKPKFLYVSEGLENHSTAKISFYDFDGKELPFRRSDYTPFNRNLVFPDNFSAMKDLAQAIAKKIPSPFVRVDLYSIDSDIYFSEITFFPCSGMIPFYPSYWDRELGKWFSVPKK